MINSFHSPGKFIQSYLGADNNPYVSMSVPSAGLVRYNGDYKRLEVYNGSTWLPIDGTSATVTLNSEAEQAIEWTLKKMKQEKEWYELASTNEAVRIALEQLEQAQTRLELTTILAKDYEQTTS